MHPLIIAEVVREPNGSLPADLLRSAYLASRRGRVVLVLNDISPFEVDDLLDPLVRALPLDIPGVLYRDAADETGLARIVPQAAMLFFSIELARRCAAFAGHIADGVAPVEAALPVFRRLGKPTCLRELTFAPPPPIGNPPIDTPFEKGVLGVC